MGNLLTSADESKSKRNFLHGIDLEILASESVVVFFFEECTLASCAIIMSHGAGASVRMSAWVYSLLHTARVCLPDRA